MIGASISRPDLGLGDGRLGQADGLGDGGVALMVRRRGARWAHGRVGGKGRVREGGLGA